MSFFNATGNIQDDLQLIKNGGFGGLLLIFALAVVGRVRDEIRRYRRDAERRAEEQAKRDKEQDDRLLALERLSKEETRSRSRSPDDVPLRRSTRVQKKD